VAERQGVPVVVMPGCARSPKENGFDWVLQRLAAGLRVTGREIMAMGGHGLLKEIAARPQPRTRRAGELEEPPPPARAPRIAALILAAGRSRRMGALNKLLADVGGEPMIARVADCVLATGARPIIVVTGHEADRVRAALGDRPVTIVNNPDYGAGLSTSLRRAVEAAESLPEPVDGAIVCLGDMPLVSRSELERLIAAFDPAEGRAICVPTHRGKQGNPILWGRAFFGEMKEVSGDVGAKHLLGEHAEKVAEVAMATNGVLADIDTPDALSALASKAG
jgi:molybdenum cofactor cytidylyltransferase